LPFFTYRKGYAQSAKLPVALPEKLLSDLLLGLMPVMACQKLLDVDGRQLRSQLTKILNVPQGYASGFVSPAASLDDHFEHPVEGLDGMMN
jgi:hypothetical protein